MSKRRHIVEKRRNYMIKEKMTIQEMVDCIE